MNLSKDDSSQENIDKALLDLTINEALKIIKEITDKAIYRNTISATDKLALDSARENINGALRNIINQE